MNRIFRASKSASIHIVVWIAAGLVGLTAISFANLISYSQRWYCSWFQSNAFLMSVVSPFLFLGATALVRFFAPDAKGSGIPQVLIAIEESRSPRQSVNVWNSPLVSIKTAIIKMISAAFGILGGASIGREGPTVQIAASIFAWIGQRTRRFLPQIEFDSFLIAGAASGVAAAFNTPIAGIAFAIEEVAEGAFGEFRQFVMLAVIIAGVCAQAFQGDYLYFGHPSVAKPEFTLGPETLSIGLFGGFLGGLFALILAKPRCLLLPKAWWLKALMCGLVCSLIGLYSHGNSAGSGYEITKQSLDALTVDAHQTELPLLKFVTTVFSYLSGMAGGIFSPCLSIGAGIGLSIAKIIHFANFKACALLGMVAFFSGVVQAPLTAVIIVMEMTDEHILILPLMAAAFLAQAVGKRLMPIPLYKFLASVHKEG